MNHPRRMTRKPGPDIRAALTKGSYQVVFLLTGTTAELTDSSSPTFVSGAMQLMHYGMLCAPIWLSDVHSYKFSSRRSLPPNTCCGRDWIMEQLFHPVHSKCTNIPSFPFASLADGAIVPHCCLGSTLKQSSGLYGHVWKLRHAYSFPQLKNLL